MLIAFATHPKSAVLPAPSHPSGEHPALEWIQANGLQTNRRYPSCAFFFPSTAANTAATHSASLPPARRSRLKKEATVELLNVQHSIPEAVINALGLDSVRRPARTKA